MNRHKERAGARIAWRDGRFRVECKDDGAGMRGVIYDEQGLQVADARVTSVAEGWAWASALCRDLEDIARAPYERGSAQG